MGRLGRLLAEPYNIPLIGLEAQLEEQKNTETPLGQQLRDSADQIAANLANPKSQGPFVTPSALVMQVMSSSLETKPATYRGSVVAGFPQIIEEATEFYLTDPPPPTGDEEPITTKVVKPSLAPDVVVVLSSNEEACLARLQEEKEISDAEFAKRMARWKNENPDENPGLANAFREKFKMEPLLFNIDEVSLDNVAQEI